MWIPELCIPMYVMGSPTLPWICYHASMDKKSREWHANSYRRTVLRVRPDGDSQNEHNEVLLLHTLLKYSQLYKESLAVQR